MFKEILGIVLLSNKVLDYLISAGMFVLGLIGIKAFKYVILKKLRGFAEKTATTIDDFLVSLLEKTIAPFLYFGIFYFSLKFLKLMPYLDKLINILGMGVLTVFVVKVSVRLIGYGLELYWHRSGKGQALEHSLSGILKVTKFTVWGIAIIFFLDNLGFKISAVIAGLGIGGVAIALAAQAILKDLFSYFSIIFDRPFEVGDFIIIGDLLGTVEHIGIKTTRIRSLSGEQLIFSNSDLTDSRVRNYKRMQKRRVVFKLGVVYQTPLEKIKKISGMIKNIIESVEDTVFDRAHFFSYGDFSLIFEVVYYVMDKDYNKYMDIQQEINFAIKKEFENKKIEFAFPTQTLYINK
ncbi:MAG: mechanosensitive ion channel family protein [Candidatus Omnitrophota bacterium]